MPNTTVQAAAEGLPKFNRRLAMLGGLAAGVANLSTPARAADASANLSFASPIMTLFREWEAHYHAAGYDEEVSEDVCNAHMDRCREIEKQMMALPATELPDFVAKLVTYTGYGDMCLENDSGLIAEARAILSGCVS